MQHEELEHAIRFGILHRPDMFGMAAEDVNPMLLYLGKVVSDDYETTEDTWFECFKQVEANLDRRVKSFLDAVDVTNINGRPYINKKKFEVVEPDTMPKPGRRESAGQDEVKGSPGRELTHKQLRYMGYLHRQLGEEPDYSVISKLSQKQATMRIKELEAKLNGG